MSAVSHVRTRLTPVVAGSLGSVGATVLWALLAAWRPTVTLHLAPVLVAGIGPYVAWSRSQGRIRRDVVVSALVAGVIAGVATAGLAVAGWLEGPTWFGADATHEALLLAAAVSAVSVLIGAVAGSRASSPGEASRSSAGRRETAGTKHQPEPPSPEHTVQSTQRA